MDKNTNTTTKNSLGVTNVDRYMEHMNDKEKQAYNIAKKHLGSSFDIEKSIGFKQFIKTNK